LKLSLKNLASLPIINHALPLPQEAVETVFTSSYLQKL